jgi:hypothetical protein
VGVLLFDPSKGKRLDSDDFRGSPTRTNLIFSCHITNHVIERQPIHKGPHEFDQSIVHFHLVGLTAALTALAYHAMSLQITCRPMADHGAGGWDAPEVVRTNPLAREPRTVPQTTQRTRPDHRTGFWVAPELSQNARNRRGVDVIAIHGVGAHAIDTWTHRTKDVNWLIDERMLRHDVPNAHVMIYGYESQWKGPETLNTTVTHIAESFVDRLITQREETGARPMIFVAHCFGGIVLIKVSFANQIRPSGTLTKLRP